MRTSIILDDELAQQFRSKAREKGQSLSAFLADAGRVALKADLPQKVKPFKLITYGKGGVYPGVDLNKTSALLVSDDERIYKK